MHLPVGISGLQAGEDIKRNTWSSLARSLSVDREFNMPPEKEKRPQTFPSRTPRQPSPRTAKLRLDSRVAPVSCKHHFGNKNSGTPDESENDL